jgi:hypothetical protein
VFEEFWKFLKHEALNINEIRMVAPTGFEPEFGRLRLDLTKAGRKW